MTQTLEKERKLYTVLGLEDGATMEEVRKAYKKEAIRCHPDKNPGNTEAAELFKLINHAHQILTDKTKKAAYDRMLSSDTHKFASSAYKDSHMSDVDRARRQREQDLMRKRASRNNSGRPSVSRMADKEKEYWAKKDAERERELKQKLQRDKDSMYQRELERQKREETAKQRAEEGRRREADRAAKLERDKELEMHRQYQEGLAMKEKVNMERHRQDEARKRELERQLIRHQKQAEKIREQRLQEETDKFHAGQREAREHLGADEEAGRKAIMVEQLKLRRTMGEEHREQRTAIGHHNEQADLLFREVDAREDIEAACDYSYSVLAVDLREFETRFMLVDEECLSRCVMARQLRAGVRYWLDAYSDREHMYISHSTRAAALAAAYQEARMAWGVQHSEIKCRTDVIQAALVEFKSIDSAHILFSFYIKEKERFGVRESNHRCAVVEDEKRSRGMTFSTAHALLQVMAREEQARRRIEADQEQDFASSREVADIRMQRRREEEARRALEDDLRRQLAMVRSELDSAVREKLSAQRDLRAARDEMANMHFEMKVLRGSYETTQVKNNDLVKEVDELRKENKALKGEVAGLSAMCTAVQAQRSANSSPSSTKAVSAPASAASLGSMSDRTSSSFRGPDFGAPVPVKSATTPRGGALQRKSPGRRSTASPHVTKARSPRAGGEKKRRVSTAQRVSSPSPVRRSSVSKPAAAPCQPLISTPQQGYTTSPPQKPGHTPPRLIIIAPHPVGDHTLDLGGSFSLLNSTAKLQRMY